MNLLVLIIVLSVTAIIICLIFLIYKFVADNADKTMTSQKKLFAKFKTPVKTTKFSKKEAVRVK